MTTAILAVVIVSSALGYAALSAFCFRDFPKRARQGTGWRPPVTVLKPLCGDEPNLYENLKSFFEIDYPRYQIVFGARDESDAALATVSMLQAEFPDQAVSVVTDSRGQGANLKVRNLVNMLGAASHDVLVISDSDIRVAPDYLKRIVPPLADEGTGAVTCAYLARGAQNSLANRLGCLHVNHWFLPAVFVARRLGERSFCLGSTIALRRNVLQSVGGFEGLREFLADDYVIGHRLAQKGYKVELADCIVETTVGEKDLRSLIAHELRWALTIRSVEPLGFALSCVTFTVPVCFVSGLLMVLASWTAGPIVALTIMVMGLFARLLVFRLQARLVGSTRGDIWLLPIRDVLSFGVWAASFLHRSVVWRGVRMSVSARGVVTQTATEVRP